MWSVWVKQKIKCTAFMNVLMEQSHDGWASSQQHEDKLICKPHYTISWSTGQNVCHLHKYSTKCKILT